MSLALISVARLERPVPVDSKVVLSVDAISAICRSSPNADSASEGTLVRGTGVGAAFAGAGDDAGDGEASSARACRGGPQITQARENNVAAISDGE